MDEKNNHPGAPDDMSFSDQAFDYSEMIQHTAFLGDFPVIPILEGIQKQFEDYINMEDITNYVDVFYTQLNESFHRVNSDETEEHPVEIREALTKIQSVFIDHMVKLFESRLTITFADWEGGVFDSEDMEFIIRRSYEFFILRAKNNFKNVISKSVSLMIHDIPVGDESFLRRVQESIEQFNPLITTVTPTQFLQLTEDKEIFDLFDNNRIIGNFLRKYTPKLYKNEEFTVELINYITMVEQFKSNIIDS